jgi:energy-coupling factor transport system substrate-specific component
MRDTPLLSVPTLGFILAAALLNAGVGCGAQLLKLPVFLDLIGSITVAVLLGPVAGVAAAVLGILLLGLLTTPIAFAYAGTAVVATLCAGWFTRWGYLRRWPATIGFGILLGIISAVISAPITAYFFGGITFVGADSVIAFFKSTGHAIATSVFLGGLSIDPLDKLLVSVCAFLLIAVLPDRLTARFRAGGATTPS